MQYKQPEAITLANDRPWQIGDDLYQWANDAEDMLRDQHAEIERKDALLQQALDALELAKEACDSSFTKYDATIVAITEELSQ